MLLAISLLRLCSGDVWSMNPIITWIYPWRSFFYPLWSVPLQTVTEKINNNIIGQISDIIHLHKIHAALYIYDVLKLLYRWSMVETAISLSCKLHNWIGTIRWIEYQVLYQHIRIKNQNLHYITSYREPQRRWIMR